MLPDALLEKFFEECNEGIPHIALVVTTAAGHIQYIIKNGLEQFVKLSSIVSDKFSESILAVTRKGEFCKLCMDSEIWNAF